MNASNHIVLFCLLFFSESQSFGCLKQTSQRSIDTVNDESVARSIAKSFRINRIRLNNYDTIVQLDKYLLALGKGSSEKYRKYLIVNKLGNVMQRDISFSGEFQFKEGLLPITTRFGADYLLKTGDLSTPWIAHWHLLAGDDFRGGISEVWVDGKVLPGIDYTKSGRNTPMHDKRETNPFHVLDNYLNHQFELMIPKYYDSIAPYREGKIRMVMKKGLFGFLDTTGREVVAPILTDFDEPDQYNWQHLRRVQYRGKYGFVDDRNGQQVIPFDYEATVASTYPFTWLRKAAKWGCINQTGKVLIPFIYDTVSYFDTDSISLAGKNGRMGHIRANGTIVTPLLYESVQPFVGGMALVQQAGRYGYVNQTGQLTIPAVYARATSFRNGQAQVERFGLKITIDKQGHWINYRLGTGWNLSIVLFFLALVVIVAYWRRVF